eukprot:Seg1918.4 transcript_id=Seg1918.4/GoldUCD/mRNA.D3Y31 product="hypothetical protein" protein_id=Seg1918.4/GoldUCD/D3Y31
MGQEDAVAVEEILQQSGVPPSSTSAAAKAKMPPPAPVTSAPSAVKRSFLHDDNRPGETGTNPGPPESAWRTASHELRDAFAPYRRNAYQFTSTSAAAEARMSPPAPVTSAPSAVQRSTLHDENRPSEAGTNSGPPESAWRSASQELRDAFAPYS